MNYSTKIDIIRRQVNKKLSKILDLKSETTGVVSWIDYIREALGMSVSELAKKSEISQATVSQIIKREKEGRITLQTLKSMAETMDCELVYCFVPKKSLDETIESQAKKKVMETMKRSDIHMTLEDQKVEDGDEERILELIKQRKNMSTIDICKVVINTKIS